MPLSVSTRSSIPSTCAFVKLVWPPSLAPYFSSIHLQVEEMKPHYARI